MVVDNYGFLDAECEPGWDIQKQVNGPFLVDEGSGLQRVWNEGNDGSGSGLDADKLDGLEERHLSNRMKVLRLMSLVLLELVKILEMEIIVMLSNPGGAWSNPFPDLVISYHTGIRIGGH